MFGWTFPYRIYTTTFKEKENKVHFTQTTTKVFPHESKDMVIWYKALETLSLLSFFMAWGLYTLAVTM